MQPEMAIEVYYRAAWDCDAGTLPVVLLLAVRHDHAEAVDSTSLEQAHQGALVGRSDRRTVGPITQSVHSSIKEKRIEPVAH